MAERTVQVTSGLYPPSIRREVEDVLKYAGIDFEVRRFMTIHTLVAAVLSIISAFLIHYFYRNAFAAIIFLPVTLILYLGGVYLLVFYRSDKRTKTIDAILPSYLQFLAANLNSGLTPYQAVKASNRKEFGILHDEMDKAVSLSLGAKPFSQALLDVNERVNSTAFKKFIHLFVDGMRTGGRLADLLDDLSRDITENMDLKKDINTMSKSHILFIVFAVLLGAPLLSAVSIHFVRTVTLIRAQANIDLSGVPEFADLMGDLTLSSEFLQLVLTVNIAVTAVIASALVAAIREGKNKYLFKYAVFMVPLSLAIFYVFDWGLRTLI